MDIESFCELCKSRHQGADNKWAVAFCETLQGIFDDYRFCDLSKVCRLFYGKGSCLSKAQYYRKRKYIVELYEWLANEGWATAEFYEEVKSLKLEDVISEDELAKYYFANLTAVLSYIDMIGGHYGLNDKDLDLCKSLVILSWYQVEPDEMILIKKTDLNSQDCSLQIPGTKPRRISIDEDSFKILNSLANARNFTSFPGGRNFNYRASVYLLRLNRSSQLSVAAIKGYLKRFNEFSFGWKAISLPRLRRNAIFCLVQEHKETVSINTAIQEFKDCDKQVAFGYAKIYTRWVKKYGGGNICQLPLV